MTRLLDRRFVAIAVLGLFAARCGNSSSPTSPSSSTTAASTGQASTASISDVLPAALPPSATTQTLLVSGSNFKPGLTVAFTFVPSGSHPASDGPSTQTIGGASIQNLTDSSFQVSVNVPGPGSYSLRVTNPSSPSSDPVTVTGQPSTTSNPQVVGLSPRSPTASGDPQNVYVAGINFQSGLGVTVTSPGGAVTTLDPSAIVFGSPTMFRMTATLPDTGGYSLQVTNPSSQSSDPFSFTVKGAEATPPAPPAPPPPPATAPSIAGLSPKSPTRSSQTQTVFVAGAGFAAGLSVQLTGPSGNTGIVTGSAIQNVSSTGFYLSTILSDLGSYSLVVTDPTGPASSPWTFTVKDVETVPVAPVVTSILPSSPIQGAASQGVYVNGTGFLNGLAVTLTAPNGTTSTVSGSAITIGSSTVFKMQVVLGLVGSYSLRVANPTGDPSAPFSFNVQAGDPAPSTSTPSILGLSPRSPTVSTTSQTVFVAGSNFASGLTVSLTNPSGVTSSIGGSSILSLTSTGFYFSAVLSDVGNFKLTVVNPSGQSSDAFSFNTKAAESAPLPVITGLSPASPSASTAAQDVYVSGTGFVSGLAVILTAPGGVTTTLNGSAIAFGTSSAFKMTGVIGVSGNWSMQVMNPSGATSNAFPFTVTAAAAPVAPVITSFSPDSIKMGTNAQPVYVNGTGFQTGLTVTLTSPGGASTTISGSALTFGSSSVFQMMVVLPSAGTYTVTVTNPSGLASNAKTFNVNSGSEN